MPNATRPRRSTRTTETGARAAEPRTYDRASAQRATGKKLLPFENRLVEVRDSAVHGLGLFAATTIRKGALIGVAEGRRTRRNNDHVLWIEEHDGQVWGLEPLNELRFTNHSDEPNAVFYGEELYALRTIRRGEEVLFDYDGEVAPAD